MTKQHMTKQRAFVRKRMIAALVVIAAAAGTATFMASTWESEARQQSLDRTMSNLLSNIAPMSKLDPVYQDADGDLLADPPTNIELHETPRELVFSFIASDDDENSPAVWRVAMDAIRARTGIPVKYLQLEDPKDQLEALRNGKLHVTAFSSGEVPTAVNSCGFTPMCTFGREDGRSGYTMLFIVRADSDVKELFQLRNHKIAFTRPRSNSGYKAALVLLMQKHNLLPERDYDWSFSYGHLESIQMVANGDVDVAAVASDVFAREVAKGVIAAEDFRVVYKSEKFPPVAFGYAYNLGAEIRIGLREALLGLDWAGTTLEKEFGGDKSTKFVELSYKDDWANIRRVDQAATSARHNVLGQ